MIALILVVFKISWRDTSTKGCLYALVTLLSHLRTVAKELLLLPRSCSLTTAFPRLFHFGPYSVPFVVQLATKPMLNRILIVRKTEPWFLAHSEVRGDNIFQRAATTVLATFLASATISMDDFIHCFLISWIVTHLIDDASIKLKGLSWVQYVIVVRHDPLKSHRSVKGTHQATPSALLAEITLLDNALEFFVNLHGWSNY